ncbi:MAG: hypothetical protein ACI9G1_000737 [Pirellulaceae bacterium]|jgi:hypothetical protein
MGASRIGANADIQASHRLPGIRLRAPRIAGKHRTNHFHQPRAGEWRHRQRIARTTNNHRRLAKPLGCGQGGHHGDGTGGRIVVGCHQASFRPLNRSGGKNNRRPKIAGGRQNVTVPSTNRIASDIQEQRIVPRLRLNFPIPTRYSHSRSLPKRKIINSASLLFRILGFSCRKILIANRNGIW